MPPVRYCTEFPNDGRPMTLPPGPRAVTAESCAAYDLGQGVTADEIDAAHVAALITFRTANEPPRDEGDVPRSGP